MEIEHQGKRYGLREVKLAALKAGDQVYVDSGFSCMSEGVKTVYANTDQHLCVACTEGDHVLDGQLDFDHQEVLVGVYEMVKTVEQPISNKPKFAKHLAAALEHMWTLITSKMCGKISLVSVILVWDGMTDEEKKHVMSAVRNTNLKAFLTAWEDMSDNAMRPSIEEIEFFMDTMVVMQPHLFMENE